MDPTRVVVDTNILHLDGVLGAADAEIKKGLRARSIDRFFSPWPFTLNFNDGADPSRSAGFARISDAHAEGYAPCF